MNEEENVLDNVPAIPNKLLQPDGSVTDLLGNEVSDAVPEYQNRKALPNKFLNADGTYSTLGDILALSKMLTFKGTVATEADLPSSGNHAGDVYYVEDTGAEYVWIENDSGEGSWEELGPIIDLSVYYTKTEADNRFVNATGDTMTGDLNVSDGNINRVRLRNDGAIEIWDSTGAKSTVINPSTDGTTHISNGAGGSLTLSGPKANLTLFGGESNLTLSGPQSKFSRAGGNASGNVSTAIGGGSTASGPYSTAIGGGAQAKGNYSIAVGGGANANANGSVVIGSGIINSDYSIAVGAGNNSNGYGNAIFGAGNSVINGSYTLTAGAGNTNSGVASVTLGTVNTAGGTATQAEGYRSVASGEYSHAEGQGSELTNVGTATVLTSATRTTSGKIYTDITFAQGNLDLKNGDIFNGIPCITVRLSNGTYTASFSGNLTSTFKVDDTLTISRSNHVASGIASHVEGFDTSAFAPYSHAEGYGTQTLGNSPGSHAEGSGTAASDYCAHAEGGNTTASGTQSHAEGYNTIASNYCSHAEGDQTKASGTSSHAEGAGTKASGYSSHAEGAGTAAYNSYTHTEGSNTVAIGTYSHAEGNGTVAQGYYAHAEGLGEPHQTSIGSITVTEVDTTNNIIKGTLSSGTIQPGYYIRVVTGSYSSYRTVLNASNNTYTLTNVAGISANDVLNFGIIIGRAKGEASHSEGKSTNADGNCSHAEGEETDAIGRGAHAEGYKTVAQDFYSHAEGKNTYTSSECSHVQGKYNKWDTTLAHIVGNGTADNARSNAHTLDWSGNAWFAGDVYVGSTSGTNKDAGSKKLATKEYVDGKVIPKITEDVENWGSDLVDGIYILEPNVGLGYTNGVTQNYFRTYAESLVVKQTINNNKRIAIYNADGIKHNNIGLSQAITGNVTVSEIETADHKIRTEGIYSYRNNTTYYPSAKAVYDFVTDQIATAITQAIGGSY